MRYSKKKFIPTQVLEPLKKIDTPETEFFFKSINLLKLFLKK